MTKGSFLPAAGLLAALVWPSGAAAQDAHYWTYGYGPVGQLTEGVLVGGVEDLSAVYYNPGALALIDEPRFVFGLTSVELANIDVPGAAGEGLDFDQLIFDVVPSMVAGHIGENDGQTNHFAFAFLSRHDSDWDLGYSNVQVSAASPDGTAGFGRFRAAARRVLGRRHLVASPPRPPLDRRLALRRLPRTEEPPLAHPGGGGRRRLARRLRRHARTSTTTCALLAKAGVAWRPGRWELGATVTTAGLQALGHRQVRLQRHRLGRGGGAFLSAATADGPRRRRTTLPGRWRAARPGATRARDPHDASSGSRPWPPTTSCSRNRPRWRAARRRCPSPSGERPRAS